MKKLHYDVFLKVFVMAIFCQFPHGFSRFLFHSFIFDKYILNPIETKINIPIMIAIFFVLLLAE